ncbi:MAG: hypothetical protein ACK55Z_14445, partial [bacterium]
PLPALASVTPLAMAREIPQAPAYLQAEGQRLWERAWAQAITWLSPDSDMTAIETACRLADANVAAQNKFMATLEAADARAFTAVNKAFRESLAALGFDPTARARLGVAEVQKASALDELIARRTKREK